jgi:FKBP-type peptidyl-prolyl cis-trans isomerase
MNLNLNAPLTVLAAAALGAGVAACGSSHTGGVILAPQAGATSEKITATATATSTATTPTTPTTTVSTPTTGPLSKEPVIAKPSGAAPKKLVVKDLVTGTGATAKSGSSVTVNYVGELYSTGKVFDASWKRNQTFGPFTLGQHAVISGWDQGLVGMKVGGRRELIIPPSLAYGKTGSGSTIPPNATLIFVVDLLAAK